MDKVLKYFILVLNILAIMGLMAAFISPMIDPNKVQFLSFWGLIMPAIIMVNLFFIFFWVLKARFYFILSLIAIIISWKTINKSFTYNKAEEKIETKGLKVMSYNVRVFDRYNWTEDKNTVSEMLSFIKNEYVDIICLQEFGTSKIGPTEKYILNALGEYPYRYIHYAPHNNVQKYKQGMAILSKYPLSNYGIKGDPYMKEGCLIYADVKVGKESYKIINAHFESIRFTNKYDIMEGLDSENYKNRISEVINSYNNTARIHANFSTALKHVTTASDYPSIVCTDMNNTPVSFAYNNLNENLEDAFMKNGIGFGSTYNGKYPFLRIDYIFHSKQIPLISYKKEKVRYSDHFPIIAEFNILN